MLARMVLSFTLLPLLAACGGSDEASGRAKTTVVAAFYPLAFAAERIGGETVRVTNLTPPGAEPHDLELSAREVGTIRSAGHVFYLGRGFQPAVEDAAEESEGEAVDLLEPADDRDPHVWLDPLRYARLGERIGERLGRPAAASAFSAELTDLHEEFERGLDRCARRMLVTSHAAFGHLASRYRLEAVAVSGLAPEAEPTPKELEAVIEAVRGSGATTVFFETLVSPRLARTIARETDVEAAELNPLEGLTQDELERGDDYFTVMRRNLRALRAGLGCR